MTSTELKTQATPAGGGTQRRVLAVTCIALATVVSAVASLNVAIPSIARASGVTDTLL